MRGGGVRLLLDTFDNDGDGLCEAIRVAANLQRDTYSPMSM